MMIEDKISSFKQIKITKKGIFQTATSFVIDFLRGKYDKKIIIYFKNDDETKIEVFKDVPILDNAQVEHSNKYTEHPLETGAKITDHFINNPSTIKITMVFDIEDNENIKLLLDYFYNGTLLSMKVGKEYFKNLVISQKPYEIKTDSVNKIFYNLTFQEVLLANTQFLSLSMKKVANKKDASTSNTGNKQAKKKTLLFKITDKIEGIL